jgi:small subunit ribosomal protein S4
VQLQEKQKARFSYGLTERQFRKVYEEANRRSGVTGENMLQLLELRLDNVMYRAGICATRPQARQFVSHGHVTVNGTRVNVPSYRVRKGDLVEVTQGSRENAILQWNVDVLDRTPPPWLERGDHAYAVKVYGEPLREQIDIPIREQLIVELYSK